MPVHALKGLTLDLVRTRRDHLARRQTLIAEVPGGGRIVLPVEWTDRGPPWATPTVDGTEVRLSARGLLALAQAIDTALRQELGHFSPSCSGSMEAEHASRSADVTSHERAREVDRADANDTARSARRVGKPAAQDTSPKRGCR